VLIELHQSFLDNPPAYAGVQPAPVCNLLIGNINQVRTPLKAVAQVQDWQKLLLSTDPSRLQDYTSDFWHHNSLHDEVQRASASTPRQ